MRNLRSTRLVWAAVTGVPPVHSASGDGGSASRVVEWGDLHNVRDLGGLPGAHGATRFGRVFRSPQPDALDAAGWQSVLDSGVRTIVDLRNDFEAQPATASPSAIVVHRHPIEDQSDSEFMAEWGLLLGSPEYYPEALRRWPGMFAAAFASIGDARDGGVLVHCGAGRDRTGLVVAMLLSLVGVDRDAIVDDYVSGVRETQAFLLRMEKPFEPIRDPAVFEADVAAARASLGGQLAELDVMAYLLGSGVTEQQLARIRSRLLD